MEAKGTFEVKVNAAEATAFEKSMGVSRHEIDKTWQGDFTGTSQGEMVSTYTPNTGAMAYVAIEQMKGKLGERSGSFNLAHRAMMTKGDAASAEMNVVVVKGSGTDELAGVTGQLSIHIGADGKHSYIFDYELPPT